MDASRRHEILWSDTRNFTGKSISQSFIFLSVSCKSHMGNTGRLRWLPAVTVGCITGEKHWACETHCFQSEQKQTWPLLDPSRLVTANTSLRNGPRKEWSGSCVLGIPSKNVQGDSGPMEDCSSQCYSWNVWQIFLGAHLTLLHFYGVMLW